MDDRIRASDTDREHATARLREHFAAGRLTSDELDERISAALNAKTYGELLLVFGLLACLSGIFAMSRPRRHHRDNA